VITWTAAVITWAGGVGALIVGAADGDGRTFLAGFIALLVAVALTAYVTLEETVGRRRARPQRVRVRLKGRHRRR
jgi:hypothetical protein